MKVTFFLLFSALVAASLAEQVDEIDGYRRARECAATVAASSRKKRQAQNTKPIDMCWFKVDSSITDKAGCQAASDAGQKCEKTPVFLPLGQYDICATFDRFPGKWYYTHGSNGPCDPTRECCEWFPPTKCRGQGDILDWFEKTDAECDDLNAKGKLTAAIMKGNEFDIKSVCVKSELEDGTLAYKEYKVELRFCGNGCCIFVPPKQE